MVYSWLYPVAKSVFSPKTENSLKIHFASLAGDVSILSYTLTWVFYRQISLRICKNICNKILVQQNNSCITWNMKIMSLTSDQLATYLWLHPCGHLWPVSWSHKFSRLSCAAIHLHHNMEKVTLMTEEPRTNLSVHTAWFAWRQTAGKGGHG